MFNRVNFVVDWESKFFFVRREEVEQNVFEAGNCAALGEIGLLRRLFAQTRQFSDILLISCRVDFLVSNRAVHKWHFLPVMTGDTKLKPNVIVIEVEEAHEALEQFRIGDFIVVDSRYIILYIQNLRMNGRTMKGFLEFKHMTKLEQLTLLNSMTNLFCKFDLLCILALIDSPLYCDNNYKHQRNWSRTGFNHAMWTLSSFEHDWSRAELNTMKQNKNFWGEYLNDDTVEWARVETLKLSSNVIDVNYEDLFCVSGNMTKESHRLTILNLMVCYAYVRYCR